jgi:hypothetical protein
MKESKMKCPNCGSENINKADGCLECPFPYVVGVVSISIDGNVFCHGYFSENGLQNARLKDPMGNSIELNIDPDNYLIGSEIIAKLVVKQSEIFLANVKELCEGSFYETN